jgi:lipoprotein signal peptidase
MTCNSSNLLFIPSIVFLFLSVFLYVLFVFYFVRNLRKTLLSIAAFVSISIGGLLNILERVFWGCVRDYLDFFGIIHFNTNDILVVGGLGILLVHFIYENRENIRR